jgi:hypothetical protein
MKPSMAARDIADFDGGRCARQPAKFSSLHLSPAFRGRVIVIVAPLASRL